jgi:hypothetical protein
MTMILAVIRISILKGLKSSLRRRNNERRKQKVATKMIKSIKKMKVSFH